MHRFKHRQVKTKKNCTPEPTTNVKTVHNKLQAKQTTAADAQGLFARAINETSFSFCIMRAKVE